MEGFLSSPPEGLSSASKILDAMPKRSLEKLGNEICCIVLQKKGYLSTNALAAEIVADPEQQELVIQGAEGVKRANHAINALLYIYRDAASKAVSPDLFRTTLLARCDLSQDTSMILTRVFEQKQALLVSSDKIKSFLSLGKLVKFDWKLSYASESSSCAALNTPVVVLHFLVSDENFQVSSHSLELTIAQFEEFAATIHEMCSLVETL
uniref:COMM domain-containing protein n=1 Tax=Hanusia phi TaxID=3032 RepID=A0A7S0I0Z1_9CRYP|mmetsp:Transcript_7737/g.17678  ORF Transcript_7737/g.17678 Transcript_7737/m.17678 type:complete len:209 (+) Transcript_7737:192-818(+)